MDLVSSLVGLPPRSVDYHRASRRAVRRQEREATATPATATDAAVTAENENENENGAPQHERIEPPQSTAAAAPPQYEYLDHTADVQFHAWGTSLASAFTNILVCMFAFMIDRSLATADPAHTPHPARHSTTLHVSSHSLASLLFAWMDEALFRFATDGLVIDTIEIVRMRVPSLGESEQVGYDASSASTTFSSSFTIEARVSGERYNRQWHGQGTEIKAITYSNMQVFVGGRRVDEDGAVAAGASIAHAALAAAPTARVHTLDSGLHAADLYVIVDI